MNKEEIKQKKLQIQSRIQYIDRVTNDPAYTLDINKLKALEAEKKQLTEEYKKLPPSQVILESEVKKVVSYIGNNYSTREYNGKLWLYSNGEALTSDVKLIDDKTIEAKRIVVSSDTVGLPVEYVYKLHIVKELTKEKPVGKPVALKFSDRVKCPSCGLENIKEALEITEGKCVHCRKPIVQKVRQ